MIVPLAFVLALLPYFGAAYLDPPPTIAAADTIEDCSLWSVATDTDTCAIISANAFITEAQFSTYNPSVADSCDLVVGNSYCVEQNWGIPPTPTASSSATIKPTTTPIPPGALAACEAEATSGYKQYCTRCAWRCTNEASYSACFANTFMTLNYYDSQCWQHGGNDCENKAADIVCSRE